MIVASGRRLTMTLRQVVFIVFVAVFAMVSSTGCTSFRASQWADSLSNSERAEVVSGLPKEAADSLIPLSQIFYGKITSRRFNSRAAFEDPSVRQFFPTLASYSDYYAALVDALDRANIRFNRPTEIKLLGIKVDPSGSLHLSLRFVGRNDLPLRLWNATLLRTDEWRWQDGRWWVIPGRV
jgi:hypothetical protein